MDDRRSGSDDRTGAGRPDPSAACLSDALGAAFAAVQRAQPEIADHLVKAGTEFVLAVRAVLDAALEALDEIDTQRGPTRVESIPIRRSAADG